MELNLSQFITRLFAAAQAAGIAPAEAACSQSDSFNTRVRRGELESYQVSERISLTLRGQVGRAYRHSQHAGAHRGEHPDARSGRSGQRGAD